MSIANILKVVGIGAAAVAAAATLHFGMRALAKKHSEQQRKNNITEKVRAEVEKVELKTPTGAVPHDEYADFVKARVRIIAAYSSHPGCDNLSIELMDRITKDLQAGRCDRDTHVWATNYVIAETA